MDVAFLTSGVAALIIAFSGLFFLQDVRWALRKRGEQAQIARYVRMLETVDQDMASFREAVRKSSPVRREEAAGGDSDWLARLTGETSASSRRKLEAYVLAWWLQQASREQVREELIKAEFALGQERERQFLEETNLDPTSEASILDFLKASRRLEEQREADEGMRREPVTRAR
jgi:hypothetical protein